LKVKDNATQGLADNWKIVQNEAFQTV
jgi:hypothetical protein